jgi:hypothetical protein
VVREILARAEALGDRLDAEMSGTPPPNGGGR